RDHGFGIRLLVVGEEVDADRRALARQPHRSGLADPARRPGHQRAPALQLHLDGLRLWVCFSACSGDRVAKLMLFPWLRTMSPSRRRSMFTAAEISARWLK